MSSVVFVWVVSLASISCGVYVPIGAYCSWLYYRQQRRAKILKKRYATVATVHNAFCLLAIVCGQTYPLSVPLVRVLNFHLFEAFISFCYAMVYCLLIRVWMFYYNVKHDHFEQMHDWDHLVNGQSETDIEQALVDTATSRNFFLKYKSTLGNSKFVCKLFALLWLVSLIASLSLTHPWDHRQEKDKSSMSYQLMVYLYMITEVLFIAPALVAVAVIRCKTPQFMDRLFIRNEFKYLLMSMSVAVASVVFFGVLYAFLLDEEWKEDLAVSSGWFCICTALFVNVMLCTGWVLRKLDVDQSKHENDSQQLKLSKVFIDEELFYKFAYHLRHEFSLEVLLAFYEISHFKQWILLSEESTSMPNLMQSFIVNRFADSLPKPNKVYSANQPTHEQLKDAARYIFVKYIQTDSSKEINISYASRQKYYALMGAVDWWNSRTPDQMSIYELYTLYDEVLSELYSLLSHSFYRFKQYC